MGHAMKTEIGFGEKHLDCGMSMPMEHEENSQDNQKDVKNCCENITEHLQVDEDVQLNKFEVKFNLSFALALIQVYIFGSNTVKVEYPNFPNYTSPPPIGELHLLYQTFLI